jgi:hypothetical protein
LGQQASSYAGCLTLSSANTWGLYQPPANYFGMQSCSVAVDQARTGDHPFEPVVVNRSPIMRRSALKVVVFNAAGGRSLPKTVECLRRPPLQGADVILLCEAGWRINRSNGREFAAELAKELGMSFAFMVECGVPRSSPTPGAFIGNAILSSQPLSQVVGSRSDLVAAFTRQAGFVYGFDSADNCAARAPGSRVCAATGRLSFGQSS